MKVLPTAFLYRSIMIHVDIAVVVPPLLVVNFFFEVFFSDIIDFAPAQIPLFRLWHGFNYFFARWYRATTVPLGELLHSYFVLALYK